MGLAEPRLLRWLIGHPNVEVVRVTSREHAGRPVDAVHLGLLPTSLRFEADDEHGRLDGVDLAFLAYPTQVAAQLGDRLALAPCRVIDLSGAFRFRSALAFERAYGFAHPCPAAL